MMWADKVFPITFDNLYKNKWYKFFIQFSSNFLMHTSNLCQNEEKL